MNEQVFPPPSDRVAATSEIRTHFPALQRRHNGLPVAYFDGPGGTQVPQAVADAVADYLCHHNANSGWQYPTSHETDAAMTAARETFADFLGGRPDEIVFGNNMTSLTYHFGRALGRGWGPGDEIVVTELDHHANIDPWRALERERGVTVRVVPMRPKTCDLDPAELNRALTPRTKLLAIGAASNVFGTITDVRAAADRAHAVGALVFVDAVHYAAHNLMDVAALDCDFAACSPYKFYGPHMGVLWGRKALIESLDVPRLEPATNAAPKRLETGTMNHEGIVGGAAAVNFLASLSSRDGERRDRLADVVAALHRRGAACLERLWEGLHAIAGVAVFGPPPGQPRTATISFTLAGRPSHEVARALGDGAVFLSNGNFYALTAVRRLGHERDGLVRAGCAAYTTLEEVDRLLEGVAALSG